MYLYFKAVSLVLLLAFFIGFAGPFLVSHQSYELPLLFVAGVIILGAFAFKAVKNFLEKKDDEKA